MKPLAIKLEDETAERVRRSTHDAIVELQSAQREPVTVSLPDGDEVVIQHSLGRPPKMVRWSPPRGPASAGYVCEIRNNSYDRSKVVVLQANGYGATVTLEVEIL